MVCIIYDVMCIMNIISTTTTYILQQREHNMENRQWMKE